jgi:hypothetical protein
LPGSYGKYDKYEAYRREVKAEAELEKRDAETYPAPAGYGRYSNYGAYPKLPGGYGKYSNNVTLAQQRQNLEPRLRNVTLRQTQNPTRHPQVMGSRPSTEHTPNCRRLRQIQQLWGARSCYGGGRVRPKASENNSDVVKVM